MQRKYGLSVFGASPDFDWAFILVLGVILFACSAWFSVGMYNQVTDIINAESITPTVRKEKITLEQIDDLAEQMAEKRARFEDLTALE